MNVLYFVLLLLALICFVGSAARVNQTRVNLLGAGLAFWVLVELIQRLRLLG